MKNMKEMSNFWLIIVGICSFLPATYYAAMLTKIVPEAISETNKYGISWIAIMTWSIIGAFAIAGWIHGNMAATINTILRERHFK